MDKEQLNGALDEFLLRLIDTADKALTAGEEAVTAATGLLPEVLRQLIHWKIAEQLVLLALCALSLLFAYKMTRRLFRYFGGTELDMSKVEVKDTAAPGDYLQTTDNSIRGPILRIDSDGDFVTDTPGKRFTHPHQVKLFLALKPGYTPPQPRDEDYDPPVIILGSMAIGLAVIFPLLTVSDALFTLVKLYFAPYVYLIDYIRAM